MNRPSVHGVDANLIVNLDALLREGSVTGAARCAGVTQSAMSHALRRLRDHFGDPLLVRVGQHLERTPRAVEMQAEVARLVREIAALLVPSGEETDTERARRLEANYVRALEQEVRRAREGERAAQQRAEEAERRAFDLEREVKQLQGEADRLAADLEIATARLQLFEGVAKFSVGARAA